MVWHLPCRSPARCRASGAPVSREPTMKRGKGPLLAVLAVAFLGISQVVALIGSGPVSGQSVQADFFRARHSGARGGAAGPGGSIPGLTTEQSEMLTAGLGELMAGDTVKVG